MTGKLGVGKAELPLGAPAMVTAKSTPANAELVAVVCFELMVTSVNKPMTAEGLTSNTLPLPLFVFIATSVWPTHDADALPEQIPVFVQKPLTTSQVVPLAEQSVSDKQATAPWQVCVAVGQFAVVVQARSSGLFPSQRG